MCFKNLPIEFDPHGRPRLRETAAGFAVTAERDHEALVAAINRSAEVRDFTIDPVTRVAGALAFHLKVDLAARAIVDARAAATMFRGYEVILRGRVPTEAIDISSRACGVCGGVHATCSAMCLEMAAGIKPPPMAIIARNLGEAAELIYDHTLHLFLLAGPDYSERMVRQTNPTLWTRAETSPAAHAGRHGFATIGELMRALNPLTGSLYLEAIHITRQAREIASLMLGKYPHPSTILPAGLGTRITAETYNQVLGRIVNLLDYAKKAALLWDDLLNFFLEANPAYAEVGRSPANFICVGIWDDPEAYDASFAHCNEWGERRQVTPGILIDGRLRTTRLTDINLGIEEFVDHAFYEQWRGEAVGHDPLHGPLSPYHPWNKQTIPRPEPRNWRERYSWSTAPRWDREPMESGPLARQWITAVAGKINTEFIQSHPGGLYIHLPRGQQPELTLSWQIPAFPNALERNRARAYHVGYCCMVAYTNLLKGFEYLRLGHTQMATPFAAPDEGLGVGFWEAGRGALMHYAHIENGRLANYQILTPSTWMASPHDPFGQPGPYETAALHTPILEEFNEAESFTGIDILRTIRSFDPCMPCAAHIMADDQLIVRDATSCACGVE
jgi:hydrogenase large subunit